MHIYRQKGGSYKLRDAKTKRLRASDRTGGTGGWEWDWDWDDSRTGRRGLNELVYHENCPGCVCSGSERPKATTCLATGTSAIGIGRHDERTFYFYSAALKEAVRLFHLVGGALVRLLVRRRDGDGLGALDDGVLRRRDEHLGLGLVEHDVVFGLLRAGAAEGAGGDEDHHPDHAQQDTDAAACKERRTQLAHACML